MAWNLRNLGSVALSVATPEKKGKRILLGGTLNAYKNLSGSCDDATRYVADIQEESLAQEMGLR